MTGVWSWPVSLCLSLSHVRQSMSKCNGCLCSPRMILTMLSYHFLLDSLKLSWPLLSHSRSFVQPSSIRCASSRFLSQTDDCFFLSLSSVRCLHNITLTLWPRHKQSIWKCPQHLIIFDSGIVIGILVNIGGITDFLNPHGEGLVKCQHVKDGIHMGMMVVVV